MVALGQVGNVTMRGIMLGAVCCCILALPLKAEQPYDNEIAKKVCSLRKAEAQVYCVERAGEWSKSWEVCRTGPSDKRCEELERIAETFWAEWGFIKRAEGMSDELHRDQ